MITSHQVPLVDYVELGQEARLLAPRTFLRKA
jgi:hypothetical protein